MGHYLCLIVMMEKRVVFLAFKTRISASTDGGHVENVEILQPPPHVRLDA